MDDFLGIFDGLDKLFDDDGLKMGRKLYRSVGIAVVVTLGFMAFWYHLEDVVIYFKGDMVVNRTFTPLTCTGGQKFVMNVRHEICRRTCAKRYPQFFCGFGLPLQHRCECPPHLLWHPDHQQCISPTFC